MTLHRWLCTACALYLLGCGQPLVDQTYRGAPLFEFEGQLDVQGRFEPGVHNIRLSIFWLPDGPATVRQDWIEQASASVVVDFPSSFTVKVFEPPKPEHYFQRQALGRLVMYDDLDQNGRYSRDEPVVGGAPNQGLVYTPPDLDEQASFTVVSFPLRCRTRPPRNLDAYCALPIGEPCTENKDCCDGDVACESLAAVCIPQNSGQQRFPNGYCVARTTSTLCAREERGERGADHGEGVVASRPLQINYLGRLITVFVKRCESSSDCRAEYVCEPAYQVCLPDRPVRLAMSAAYEPESICVEDTSEP
jgi:hypothetical protein